MKLVFYKPCHTISLLAVKVEVYEAGDRGLPEVLAALFPVTEFPPTVQGPTPGNPTSSPYDSGILPPYSSTITDASSFNCLALTLYSPRGLRAF
ncbi:Predicted EndoIII-related endonuclease [Desulfurococcus amylolyticus 1221n]|uniref:Predicted EndoIII-related endonuclease n=1 Tax=Desulfurococcus amylolyticus (strain DSM 18924 / JCM 16383 / VKM B-2413 / 1221n) TaxID=490899 RepID=B8D5Z0_DESA1|nr:hypothetical protein [Desulfurococcus amylolyticus]ACL11521.1 Predicted EndoIII-related endonuclease [Desulfurococcus amylolyticus 1221n]